MNSQSVFVSLSSRRMADLIRKAERHVCYASPGIQLDPANALVDLRNRSSSVSITVNLDFDEKTLRLGYGCLEAVEKLEEAQIQVSHFAGLRSSVLIVDDHGWVFTPTALYLESEPHSDETPNALRLSSSQVSELLLRLSPNARQEAIHQANSPEDAQRIASIPLDSSTQAIERTHFNEVKAAIDLAPPVQFDVARQVRVFEPYLQYVDLSLRGAAIQRHRVRIPKAIQKLGSSKDIEGRLKTTFDLIEKSGEMSSESLEAELNELRDNFTPSLGKPHGRLVLKNAKPRLMERIAELHKKLQTHQTKLENELQKRLDESKSQVIENYLPLAQANLPDALIGQSLLGKPDDEAIRGWLKRQLDKVFPEARTLVKKMKLEERYKDVTFETLNQPDFLEAVKKAFPLVDWDKTYSEFKAAGEKNVHPST